MTSIVKTYPSGAGMAVRVHFQGEPGYPVWDLLFYVDAGRVTFGSACWHPDGEPVECPANSPVRKACAAAVRRAIRRGSA